jgi:multicomponent Na+:H+ antiporter subunit F
MSLHNLTLIVVLPLLSMALMLSFIRLVRGPSLPDRVIALDLIATMVMGVIAVYAITVEQAILLDGATLVALISFLGTVAFARYIERRV